MNTLIAIFATIGIIVVGLFLYGMVQGLRGRKPPAQTASHSRQGEST